MEIYVDELPKCCNACPHCYHECNNIYHCAIQNEHMEFFKDDYLKRQENCPLKLLKDHDKQVRNEVCEEIRKYYTTPIYDKENPHTDVRVLLSRLEQIQGETTAKKSTFKNYSGFDLLDDLTKPCKKCGWKPTIGNMYGYKGKYQLACMNCNCTNAKVASDDNFYTVIDLWNKAQGETNVKD